MALAKARRQISLNSQTTIPLGAKFHHHSNIFTNGVHLS